MFDACVFIDFDRWYPDMIWHVLACLFLPGGILTCLGKWL